jgi:hypothetical protein
MFKLSSILLLGIIEFSAVFASAKKSPPVWPNAFNATLLKIGTDKKASSQVIWTKLYYKYIPEGKPNAGGFSRFDFYDHYFNYDREWTPICSIVFYPNDFYVIKTKTQECNIRPGVGNLSPDWLRDAKFNDTFMFRGIEVENWALDTGPSGIVQYYAMASSEWKIPLRSTNQAEDPGATDYFDFVVGDQDDSIFKLPPTCSKGKYTPNVACPFNPDDEQFLVKLAMNH